MSGEAWTVRRAILWTTDYLEKKGADSPRTDADLLLADALGVDRVRLLIDFDKPLLPEELAAYRQRIERRAKGEPTAYILGHRDFFGRDFLVDPRVLIPRPETEELVQIVLRDLPQDARVLDLCAGSGCIGLTVAAEREDVKVDLVELDPGAAEVASANAAKVGVQDRCSVLVGDLFEPLEADAAYHAIVSNPPYIPTSEIADLSREVKMEPHMALDGGEDGLALVRRIADGAASRLVPGGRLALELSLGQPTEAVALFLAAGFDEAHTEQDFTKRDRFLVATRK